MTAPGAGQAGPAQPAAPGEGGGRPPGGGGAPAASEACREVVDTGIGRNPVKPAGIALLALVILALLVFAVYCLIAVWPVSTAPTSAKAAARATASHIAGLRLMLDQEQRLFIVVAVTGALGGLLHSARSLYEYVGDRKLLRSWMLFYLSLPFVGGGLSVLFYLILRGGLITGSASEVNFFGFAAISALVGLFTPEAALKLKQIFSTLLIPAEPGRDSLQPGEGGQGGASRPPS